MIGGLIFWLLVFHKPLKRLNDKFNEKIEQIEDRIFRLSTRTTTTTYLSGTVLLSFGGESLQLTFHIFWMVGIFLFPRALILKPSKKFIKEIPETMYMVFFAPLLWLLMLD